MTTAGEMMQRMEREAEEHRNVGRTARQIEFAGYGAFRNRLLTAAGGGFALSFSALQVEVARATPGLTDPWPPLMFALGLGLLSAVVELGDNRLATHRLAKRGSFWSGRVGGVMLRFLHIAQVAMLAAMALAVIVSFIALTSFGSDVARAALEGTP